MHPRHLLALFVLSACGASAPPPVADPGPTAEEREATCNAHIERYREILSSASNTCATDAECGVYGGLDPTAVCGGLTDIETARALTAVSDASTADNCPRAAYSCPAIEIHCRDGACR